MKCQVCKTHEARTGVVTCSDNCDEIRLKIRKLADKYTPTNGCDNCWGDLGVGCSDICRNEFRKSYEFVRELYDLIRMCNKVEE